MWKIILERLYREGKVGIDRLANAVTKGLITEQEKQEILS